MRLGVVGPSKPDQAPDLWKKGSCANLYSFIVNKVDDVLFATIYFEKKIDNTLFKAPHNDWKKKRVHDSSFENSFSTYFQSKTLRKTF